MPENEKKASAGNRGKIIVWVIGALIIIGGVGAGIYYYVASKTVYIDLSQIQAPLINLSPTNSGVLQALYVNPGDTVTANEPGGARGQ
jgi:multidrug resistance efflux pump